MISLLSGSLPSLLSGLRSVDLGERAEADDKGPLLGLEKGEEGMAEVGEEGSDEEGGLVEMMEEDPVDTVEEREGEVTLDEAPSFGVLMFVNVL